MRKRKPAELSEKQLALAHYLAERIIKTQRSAAEYFSSKISKMSPRLKQAATIIFMLTAISYCSYLTFNPFFHQPHSFPPVSVIKPTEKLIKTDSLKLLEHIYSQKSKLHYHENRKQ